MPATPARDSEAGELGAEGKHRLSINILSLEKDAGKDIGNEEGRKWRGIPG